jgi:hypothetical protein
MFCVTGNGKIGLVHGDAVVGDKIAVLSGSRIPFTLREKRPGMYVLVGDCFVHGAMDSQPFSAKEAVDQEIVIV